MTGLPSKKSFSISASKAALPRTVMWPCNSQTMSSVRQDRIRAWSVRRNPSMYRSITALCADTCALHFAFSLQETISGHEFASAVGDFLPAFDHAFAGIVAATDLAAERERDGGPREVPAAGADDGARGCVVADQRQQRGTHQRRVQGREALLRQDVLGHLRGRR